MLREEEILKLRKASEVSNRSALLVKCGVFSFVYCSVGEHDKHVFLPVLQDLSRI